jgi:hypothetical protein
MPTHEGGWDFIGGGLGELDADTGPTVRTWIPEEKMWIDRPLVGTPVEVGGQTFASQWHVDSYIAGLHREIEGVEHKLSHLDDEVAWWQGTPSSEQRERLRSDLESEKTAALAELKRLAKGTKARG